MRQAWWEVKREQQGFRSCCESSGRSRVLLYRTANKKGPGFSPRPFSMTDVQLLASKILAVCKLGLAVVLVHECNDVDADFLWTCSFTFTVVGA